MNKSKFLKRSLATLLAVLMVVAMVPMSAFAADPDVIKIGGSVAKLDGTTYTVSFDVPNGTSGVIEKALENVTFELQSTTGTTVAVLGKDGKPIGTSLMGRPGTTSATKTVNIIAKATKPEGDGVYFGNYTDMKLRVTEKGKAPVSYDLVITVNERRASNDVTLEDVVSTRIVNAEVGETTITITKPVGAGNTATELGLTSNSFVKTNNNASVSLTYAPNTDIISTVTVTAEDKSTKTYGMEYVVEKIFDEFKVTDIIDEATEEEYIRDNGDGTTTATGNVIVTVKVPYATYLTKNVVPTFVPTSAMMTMHAMDFSPIDGTIQSDRTRNSVPSNSVPFVYGVYDRDRGHSTSGEAIWVHYAYDTDNANTQYENISEAINTPSKTYTMRVRSSVSSQYDGSELTNSGYVYVKVVPEKNNEAKLSSIRVSMQSADSSANEGAVIDGNYGDTTSGNPNYNQVTQAITSTSTDVVVGDLLNSQLSDWSNAENKVDVISRVTRDLKLDFSTNATVTWLNPYESWNGSKEAIELSTQGGYVIVPNVDLRNYSSTPMKIMVDAEDGSNYQTYNLKFVGRPSGTPTVNTVKFKNANDSIIADNKGNIVIHVPFEKHNGAANIGNIAAILGDNVSVTASAGATVVAGDANLDTEPTDTHIGEPIGQLTYVTDSYAGALTNITNDMFVDNMARNVIDESSPYAKADFFMEFHAAYDNKDMIVADNCDYWDKTVNPKKASGAESATKVYIYLDAPNNKANITELIVTSADTILGANAMEGYPATKYEAEINHDNKSIRVEVPYSFAMNEDRTHKETSLSIYKLIKDTNSVVRTEAGANNDVRGFKFDHLEVQCGANATDCTMIVEDVAEKYITTAANEAKFDWKKNYIPVKVYAEDVELGDTATTPAIPLSDSTKHATEYKLYLVRQNANHKAELESITASAPVSVELDPTVARLNRFIIKVPKNYNSDNGLENAKPFTLTFKTSEGATVRNVQNVWATPNSGYTVEFKVVNDKLYYQDREVTVTDGRVMHFTVWAEDGRTSAEYEFIIGEGEASSDATLASVRIDDKVSFDKNDKAFSVKDLSEDMNYDVKKLPIYFEVTTPGATVTVDGTEYKNDTVTGTNIIVDLSEGKTVTAVVTAADGTTTETYTLSMRQGPDPVEKPSSKYTDLDKAYSGLRGKVEKAIDMGIMGSTSKTALVFGPTNNITRKDVAVIIARADLIASDEKVTNADEADTALKAMYTDGKDAFTDLGKCNDVQKAAIRYCAEKKIVSGTGNGFAPDGALTREQMAVILTNWTKTTVPSGTANINNIADWNSVSNWAKPYVNAVYGKMMNGVGNNKFGPKGIVNREQTASVLVDAFGIIYPEFGK